MARKLTTVSGNGLGQPMGRISTLPRALGAKVSLSRVRLDRGGYDSGRAYWGHGQPLFWACSEDCTIEWFFRAADRDAARAIVLAKYPTARFYR
jgi:hypothetical protein